MGEMITNVCEIAPSRRFGPVGSTIAAAAARRVGASAGYREARERLAPYEQLARIVIRRRMELAAPSARRSCGSTMFSLHTHTTAGFLSYARIRFSYIFRSPARLMR